MFKVHVTAPEDEDGFDVDLQHSSKSIRLMRDLSKIKAFENHFVKDQFTYKSIRQTSIHLRSISIKQMLGIPFKMLVKYIRL